MPGQKSSATSSPAHSAPIALREGVLYVRVLQPAVYYELKQMCKSEILRKLRQRFGAKTIRDIRFRVGRVVCSD
jgi:predicted nucleic acid-binding Zn ribbon protein